MTQVEESSYSLQEIITIASLIEEETDGTDQANIASVIYNRLEGSGNKQGTYGLLQIDATLLYALPDHTGPITSADMQTDSPYNTVPERGPAPHAHLQPGPGLHRRGAEPQRAPDYYYYALGTDGKHHFSTTLAEHNAFVNSIAPMAVKRGQAGAAGPGGGHGAAENGRGSMARTRCIWRAPALGCGPLRGTSPMRSCPRRWPLPTATASGSTAPSIPCPGTTRRPACRSTWNGWRTPGWTP